MGFNTVTDNNVFQCIMSLGYEDKGWQEKFYLPQITLVAAVAASLNVALFRRNCLPTTCEMDWVRVTKIGGLRDGTSVFSSYPVAGLYSPGSTPDPEDINPNLGTDSLRYRLENDEGQWSTRFMGGIPDAKIDADVLTTAIATVTTPPVDPTAVNATTTAWETLVGQFFAAIRTQTMLFRKRVISDVRVFQTSTISATISRGVEYKSRGRRFGERRGRANPR